MTGTPIENRLSELWSIFDYLMPGFLYGYEAFRREIETPIVKNQDEDVVKRLQKMTGPFILRRLKEEGIRVEGIVFCEHLAKAPHHPLNHSIEEVTHAIDRYRNGRDVIVMGMANAGKSTLLNALCADSDLTTSPHPGTTLDFV